ncbi:MAG: CoA:oxalate CoA-transferase [Gammaproteobacteria bacterium]|jgi:CoA:oxalate CoA-transferase
MSQNTTGDSSPEAPANASALAGHPLQGVRVLDLGQIYNGPYAGFLLAMAGADVLKIEPLGGEALRARGGMTGLAFSMGILNSNKRGIALNLKSDAGHALFIELVQQADVVLENFAPGVMERLGLGAERLQQINPRLIYASSTGYGRSGPDRDNLAMDLTIQAYSGVMSINGPADGPPLKAGAAVCDFLGGVHLYGGIVTALYERERTGIGRVVEIAMLEATFPILATSLTGMYNLDGVQPERRGNAHPASASAPYGVYEAADGHVAIICVREAHWQRLLEVMQQAGHAQADSAKDDPRFADQKIRGKYSEAVDAVLNAWTRTVNKSEIIELLRAHNVPVAPVRTLPEVVEDPHMHSRGTLQRVNHPEFGEVTLPHSPLRFDGEERLPVKPSPRLGEHTYEVLGDWLDYKQADVDALLAQGVMQIGEDDD